VLLEAAVVFILLATDVTGVTETTCGYTKKKEEEKKDQESFYLIRMQSRRQ